MLELHVWGPAFSLPSIDPHCLAAIAYLQQAVPQGKWKLVASSDPTLSPSNELPALRNGTIWVGGFRNIFHYVAQYSAGKWILDAGLPEQEEADCIAFSSFIELHGQPLLDLSLYVSSQNYTTTTRPLYNTFQHFPLPYLTPPALRAAARKRTEHLNLSSLDIDTEDGQPPPDQSIIPDSLRRPKNTVSSLLAASPETNAQIRLDALATNFLEPLSKLKGWKQFMVSDTQFSSLDCLALGYLSLMLVPDLPQPWLARTMKEKFPGLCTWTKDVGKNIFGGSVSLVDAGLSISGEPHTATGDDKGKLPWKAPNNGGIINVGGTFMSSLLDSMPVVGQLSRTTRMRQRSGNTTDDEFQSDSWQNITIFGSLVAGLGVIAGYMFHQGIIPLGSSDHQDEKRTGGYNDFGEAGAALSILSSQMDSQSLGYRNLDRNYSHGEPVVEVDVDVDRGRIKTTDSVV